MIADARPRLEGVTPWPPELAARYRAAGFWPSATLPGLLDDWATRSGDAVAVVDGERRLSYAELAAGSA
jgi:2,3-dihydroxybenzoate-AMP ligase